MGAAPVGVDWRLEKDGWRPFVGSKPVAWAPHPGAQDLFLRCPLFEVLLEGPRGGGKTQVLLMNFAQYVGLGFGPELTGILFRHTFPQLAEVVRESKILFNRIWPGSAAFNEAKYSWSWTTGETLRFGYMDREDDIHNYHGQQFAMVMFEELALWESDRPFRAMFACVRSGEAKTVRLPRADDGPDVEVALPRQVRANTNPYGPGFNWVKARYGLGVLPGRVCTPTRYEPGHEGKVSMGRCAIHCSMGENKTLMHAEPDYRARTVAAANSPAMEKAWTSETEGWNQVAGGMFDDLWDPRFHVLPGIPWDLIPAGWRIDRAFDFGQSKPFSVGWYAESNGEPLTLPDGRVIGSVRGDVIRVAEWYGWQVDAQGNGKPNVGLNLTAAEIAQGILDREKEAGAAGRVRQDGPADSAIFDESELERGRSIAGDMARKGVRWSKALKGPGSRIQGWAQLRQYLKDALPVMGGVRERPGLFVCEGCEQFIRTFPVMPRDPKNPDDLDTKAEDHIADEVRYRVRSQRRTISIGSG